MKPELATFPSRKEKKKWDCRGLWLKRVKLGFLKCKLADSLGEAKSADFLEEVKSADSLKKVKSADSLKKVKSADSLEEVKSADSLEEVKSADSAIGFLKDPSIY